MILVLSSCSHPDSTISFGVSVFHSEVTISALQWQTANAPPDNFFQSPSFVHASNINIRINSYGNTMEVFLDNY